MRNIVGTQIHEEILGLIDRAKGGVILVSPFIRMWPELRWALARAVARGVRISLITRGPRGGPSADDLAIFEELEATIDEVPDLHLKAYLSEREAIHTSVNLTRQSVGKSLESSLLFDRDGDAEGWRQVFEVWQKTLDDAARAAEGEPVSFEHFLDGSRARADRADAGARAHHRYCIVCGETASDEGDPVVCLRCRAGAIAADRSPEDVTGARCARCNGQYRRASVERPFCDPCYREEMALLSRRPARWFVAGATNSVEVWSAESAGTAFDNPTKKSNEAVARRWGVLMQGGGWLTAMWTASTSKPTPLWRTVLPGAEVVDLSGLDGVLVERVPTRTIPGCAELPDSTAAWAQHHAFTRHEEARSPTFWQPEQQLARWATNLPRSADPSSVTTPEWLWRALLGARPTFPAGLELDPARAHVLVDIELGVPKDLGGTWRKAVDSVLPWMLASLHQYDEADVREWLARADPKALERIVAALTSPAPFGTAKVIRSQKGKVSDLPHRSDRVAAVRVAITDADADGWTLKASAFKAKKVSVH